jgi:hypothetical protein
MIEITEREEGQAKRLRDAGLPIVRARGRPVPTFSGTNIFLVAALGFTIAHATPFNRTLIKRDSEEHEFWRRFDYRLTISHSIGGCLDVYWNTEDQNFTRWIRVDRKNPWEKEFLKYARRPEIWS